MYRVLYVCKNCSATSEKHIAKGEMAPEYIECWHCGCWTAAKTWMRVQRTWTNIYIDRFSFSENYPERTTGGFPRVIDGDLRRFDA